MGKSLKRCILLS